METAPKNKSSIRDLQLPDPLIAVLNEHKQRQQRVAQHLFSKDCLICGCNRPLRDTSIAKRNRKYAKAAGLPRIKIHEYRHSHATFLINNNVNIVAISKRLGHFNITETLDTYSHLYQTTEQEALNVLNRLNI